MSAEHRVIVLGAGMVGAVIAEDLASDPALSVTLADVNPEAFSRLSGRHRLQTLTADLADPAGLGRAVEGFDLAVGALPGRLGFAALRALIDAGLSVVDISFMPEDAWDLDEAAKEGGVTAVVDCGVAPGMSNLLAGYAASVLDALESVAIYVGGLPKVRSLPWQYKAPFSPADVIEEYVRPARTVVDGCIVSKPALSEPELLDFPGVGTLEAFNTDGLRSLAHTLKARNMVEKTLRWPGHRELVAALRDSGFFGTGEIDADGVRVRPLDVTSSLLFPRWTFEKGEVDITVMRVEIKGTLAGAKAAFTYDLLDEADPETGFSSMARTTGFPAAIMVREVLSGRIQDRGVLPPELLATQPGLLGRMLEELEGRGVTFARQEPL
jgi:saccharopine dehydrogenase-like NADP-dependent oxidoreductase